MPTCLLVRHGRTTANSAGVLAGWTPGVHLDEHGEQQVQALAARSADLPISHVATSPLTRCRETAELLVAGRDVPVVVEQELGECRYGAWTGRSIRELAEDPLWKKVQQHPSGAVFPSSPDFENEGLAAMQARAVAAVRAIDAQVEQEHGARAVWVAVSHGDVIKAVLADALGMHLDGFQRLHVGPASLSAVQYTPTRPFVLRVNASDDLTDLVPPAETSGDAVPGGQTGAAPTDVA